MKLLTKFNLILLILFSIGGLILSQSIYAFLIRNAQREAMQQAELMMASAKSIREYTSSDLAPLLDQNPQHKQRFLAETVPAFGAVSTFNKLRRAYPDYSYREPALNPTNPENRATAWEADLITYLRDHPDQTHLSGERDTPMGKSLYLAEPLSATHPCMECHSVPSAAPAAMLATYGPNNGFGWKPGSIVAAQIVSVPTSVPMQKAKEAFRLLLIYLVVTLVATIIALDAGVYYIVIRPLRMVSDTADRVSKGDLDVPPLQPHGKDEIAMVIASFNRMQLSLTKAFKMLG
jgi:HAMP domain-containing protein